jgi:hypothetical protein
MCETAISADTRNECTFVHGTTGLYKSTSHSLQGVLVSCYYVQGERVCLNSTRSLLQITIPEKGKFVHVEFV